jgi:hypothetical protein
MYWPDGTTRNVLCGGLAAEDPPAVVVTVTLPSPIGSAGETTVSFVDEMTVTADPLRDPKVTDVLPATKFVPVTVTVVPPSAAPDSGDSAATVGAPAASAGNGVVAGFTTNPVPTMASAQKKCAARGRVRPEVLGVGATERRRSMCILHPVSHDPFDSGVCR